MRNKTLAGFITLTSAFSLLLVPVFLSPLFLFYSVTELIYTSPTGLLVDCFGRLLGLLMGWD